MSHSKSHRSHKKSHSHRKRHHITPASPSTLKRMRVKAKELRHLSKRVKKQLKSGTLTLDNFLKSGEAKKLRKFEALGFLKAALGKAEGRRVSEYIGLGDSKKHHSRKHVRRGRLSTLIRKRNKVA